MRKIFSITFGFGLSCMSFIGGAETKLSENLIDDSPYRIQLFTGGYVQNPEQSYAESAVLLPIWQRADKLFLAQLHYQTTFESNFLYGLDIGYRWLNEAETALWGIHTGFDYEKSTTQNLYRQMSVGAEFRTELLHTYANLYLPFNQTYNDPSYQQWQLSPTTNTNGFYNILQNLTQEKALGGGDANIGVTFWLAMNARFYVGGYYYQAHDVKTISGPSAQLQFDLYNAFKSNGASHFLNRITFESMVTQDSIYNTSWYTGLKFVFTLGKQQTLRGMQQFMEYEEPRTYNIKIRPTDAKPVNYYQNASGSPLTVAEVSNATQINNAITNNADVIAVQGSIGNLSTIHLNNNQAITGGNYTLNNGSVINLGNNGQLTAAAGQDLVQVAKNNVIENITLNADNTQHVIVNYDTNSSSAGNSVGNLTINNVIANAGVAVTISDGSQDSNIVLRNSTFNMGDVSNQQALDVNINNGGATFTIADNVINFGTGNSNDAIEIQTGTAIAGTTNFTINSIDNNEITFGDGDSNAAIYLAPTGMNSFDSSLTLSGMQNNTILFGNGDNNSALNAAAIAAVNNSTMTLNNIINNSVTFASGDNNNAMSINNTTVSNGVAAVTVNSIYDNEFNLPDSNNNDGFYLYSPDANSSITVNVNDGSSGLSAANGNTTIDKTNNVNIDPSEINLE